MWIAHDIHARGNRQQADIVVRASTNAIETECAIDIAGFAREIEVHFATPLMSISAQAIVCLATGANISFVNFHLER